MVCSRRAPRTHHKTTVSAARNCANFCDADKQPIRGTRSKLAVEDCCKRWRNARVAVLGGIRPLLVVVVTWAEVVAAVAASAEAAFVAVVLAACCEWRLPTVRKIMPLAAAVARPVSKGDR